MSEEWIIVNDWARFQHYKDRNPKWIKLYTQILDNQDFDLLTPAQQIVLVKLWLLYARRNQVVPKNTRYLSQKLGQRVRSDTLDTLKDQGWISFTDKEPTPSNEFREWPSRYIDKDTRARILTRDNHCCTICDSKRYLEIDHIIPVSRWEQDGLEGIGHDDDANLRVLCRACNRSKNSYGDATQLRSICVANLSLRTRSREEGEGESLSPLPPSGGRGGRDEKRGPDQVMRNHGCTKDRDGTWWTPAGREIVGSNIGKPIVEIDGKEYTWKNRRLYDPDEPMYALLGKEEQTARAATMMEA